MEKIKKQLQVFDDYLLLKNFSAATRSAYGCALGQFLRWRQSRGFGEGMTQEEARSYLGSNLRN